ncbi:MAG: fumarylacetoacetate hydrolase family protein [Candidatus Nanopelagicales bacterium]|nr:fumarylacetoacetate hydrolase family protein [Candidatus Nanopelagicales bacterium]MDP4905903.1 fumarylacetoacetate hydrolase family protein [Candidatus Nanopelagicales bacterium]
MCAGLNYADHAAESGMAIPEEPLLFTKAPNTVVDPLDDVLIPRGATKVDYEVDVAAGVDLWLDVDGVRRQTGSTTSLVFGFDVLVHYISQFLVLDPGDLINTGTPPGVAMGVATPEWVQPGQVVSAGITGLGQQHNRFVSVP